MKTLKIRGCEIKNGYYIFVLTVIIGIINICHILSVTDLGIPNSVNVSVAFICNIGVAVTAIVAPIFGLYFLISEKAELCFSKFYWVVLVVGGAICLVAITRTCIWFSHPPGMENLEKGSTKYTDMKDFAFQREHKNQPPSWQMIYTSREFKCCGIISYNDWEQIYLEIDADKNHDERGPRKVPDFCCKGQPTKECGTRIITEIFEAVTHVLSLCEDPDNTHSKNCIEHGKILLDLFKTGNTAPPGYEIIKVTDPRIFTSADRESLLELQAVQDICSGTRPNLNVKVMIFYDGIGRDEKILFEHDVTQNSFIPCYPDEIRDEEENQNDVTKRKCRYQLTPKNFFRNSLGFCHWVKDKEKSNDFSLKERLHLVQEDGRLFHLGCKDQLIQYINNSAIWICFYSFLILILFCLLLAFYHRYYFLYRQVQLKETPMPRWYDPLLNENPPLTSFGDVDFFPDRGCDKLPPVTRTNFFGTFSEHGSPRLSQGNIRHSGASLLSRGDTAAISEGLTNENNSTLENAPTLADNNDSQP